jgi:hypothetical protein
VDRLKGLVHRRHASRHDRLQPAGRVEADRASAVWTALMFVGAAVHAATHSICAWAAAGVAATIRARRLQTSRVSVFHRRCATTEPRHLFSGNSVSSTAAGEPTNPTITPSLHDPHLMRRPRLTVTRSVVCWRPLTGRALRPRRAIADTRPAYRAGFEPTALTHTGHLPVKGRLRVADVQNRELTTVVALMRSGGA